MKQLNNCNDITICNDSFILTDDGEIITDKTQQERCFEKCIKRSICKNVLDLIKNNKKDLAYNLLLKYINNG